MIEQRRRDVERRCPTSAFFSAVCAEQLLKIKLNMLIKNNVFMRMKRYGAVVRRLRDVGNRA